MVRICAFLAICHSTRIEILCIDGMPLLQFSVKFGIKVLSRCDYYWSNIGILAHIEHNDSILDYCQILRTLFLSTVFCYSFRAYMHTRHVPWSAFLNDGGFLFDTWTVHPHTLWTLRMMNGNGLLCWTTQIPITHSVYRGQSRRPWLGKLSVSNADYRWDSRVICFAHVAIPANGGYVAGRHTLGGVVHITNYHLR